ncbi:MAG: helix-turn-helix transcriptional regulator [Pseudomonadota bacterium]
MFSHKQVWSAIDALAARNDMSVSRLARTAGLDPTTFNKSKRESADGRLRWPSTESLSKIMAATHTQVDTLTALIAGTSLPGDYKHNEGLDSAALAGTGFAETAALPYRASKPVPLLGWAQAGDGGFFDDMGFPVGTGWDEVALPSANDGEPTFALEIAGDSMLPVYRDGDRIVLSPSESLRTGDRVVVRTKAGEVLAKELARQTANKVELRSLNRDHEDRTFTQDEIDWIARIVWASQ